jgi:hypothetical protein
MPLQLNPNIESFIDRGRVISEDRKTDENIHITKILFCSIAPIIISGVMVAILAASLGEFLDIYNPFTFFTLLIFVNYGVLFLLFYVFYGLLHKNKFSSLVNWADIKKEKGFLQGILIGCLFPSLGFLIAWVFGAFEFLEARMSLNLFLFALVALIGFAFSSTVEEILFRAYYVQEFGKTKNLEIGIALNSGLFALIHLFNGTSFSLLWMVNLTLFGLLANLLFTEKGHIGIAAGFHFGWNWTQTIIWGSKNSGNDFGVGYGVFNFSQIGSDLQTGGQWGIEANIFITITLLAFILWLIWRNMQKKPCPVVN